jgi:hypothetical protein
MRKSLAASFAAPMVCVLALAGCGGGDEPRPQRPMTTAADDPAAGPEHLVPGATVALRGCVEGAPGTDQYVLRNVRFEDREQLDPQRDLTTPGPHGITEGSWVRLDGSEQPGELQGLLGQHVSLTGTVIDTGESAIGTAGTAAQEGHAGAATRSAAADEHYAERMKDEAGRIARESMADGLAALVQVTQVDATGEPCPAAPHPQPR